MSSLPHTLAFFLIALTVLIAVHEYGHFWVARKLGVKVLRFSLGFGQVIWRRQRSPESTEFTVSLLPLGGYVRMVDEREGPVVENDRAFAFNRKPVWVRAAIVAAGPVFNLLLAVLLYWLVFMWGETGSPPVLGEPVAGSLAASSGFTAGDRILQVNDRETPTYALAMGAILEAAMEEVPIRVRLDAAGASQERILVIPHDAVMNPEQLFERLGFQAQEMALPPIIERVEPGSAADQAGLLPGDRLIRADDTPLGDWREWAHYVRARPLKPIRLIFEREGVRQQIDITPAAVSERQTPLGRDHGETSAADSTVGRVGAQVRVPEEAQVFFRLGPWEALVAAVERTRDYSLATLRMAGRMLVGQAAVDNLSGPISIAQLAGRSAQLGLDQFLKFLALVSISLGVLNLLPIPVLDGGHLVFLLLEMIRRRPLAPATEIRFQQVGMVVLMGLMILGLYLDLGRLAHSGP